MADESQTKKPPGTDESLPKKPSGTTMEGMIWNANHVLDMALKPGTKKGDVDKIMKGAKGVAIVNTVDVGLVFAGTRGSGVVMVRNDEDGEWSPPSAVSITSFKVGWVLGARDRGILVVMTDADHVHGVVSGSSVRMGMNLKIDHDTALGREKLGGVNKFVTNKGSGTCRVYTYKHPDSFEGMEVESVTIKMQAKANERFYGKAVSTEDILVKRDVTVPENSGIPDLHKKLAALEASETAELSLADEKKKEELRKAAGISADTAKEELGEEIEEVSATPDEDAAASATATSQ